MSEQASSRSLIDPPFFTDVTGVEILAEVALNLRLAAGICSWRNLASSAGPPK